MIKKIWIIWFQGLQKAPSLIKKCISSWKKYNPDWEINVLDVVRYTQLMN